MDVTPVFAVAIGGCAANNPLRLVEKESNLATRGVSGPRSKPATGKERRGIQSIEVGAALLDALAAASAPMALKDLSLATGMASSQAHRYLASYVRIGLVRQDAASGRYDLGGLSLRLGLSALARVDHYELASQAARDLTSRTNLTALVVIWGPAGPLIIRWARSSPPLVVNLSVGTLLPALASASGRVLVAFSPREVTQAIVAAEINRTGASAGDIPVWAAEIRARGYDFVSGLVIPGLAAASAPILDSQGEATAAITLLRGGAPAIPEPIIQDLTDTCRRVSREAGYRAHRF